MSQRALLPGSRSGTVLSCDFGDNDNISLFSADARNLHNHASRAENCSHVVFIDIANAPSGYTIDENTILDSVTVTGGHANLTTFGGSPGLVDESGGGLYVSLNAMPTVQNSWFEYNYAFSEGGAINARDAVMVRDSTFLSNHAATGNGGAIAPGTHAGPIVSGAVLERLRFERNVSFSEGGAINIISATDITIDRCEFIDNYSVINGGAISLTNDAGATITNSWFLRNRAGVGDILPPGPTPWNLTASGGAIRIGNTSAAEIRNVTIVGSKNVSSASNSTGGAIAVRLPGSAGVTSISNAILWDNGAPIGTEIYCEDRTGGSNGCEVEYSIVNGYGLAGSSNVVAGGGVGVDGSTVSNTDPDFVNFSPANPLAAGTDIHLMTTSPAVDTGTTAASGIFAEKDIDGEDRVMDVICGSGGPGPHVDLGADEVFYPSCWYMGTQCHGDANSDGVVNSQDAGLWAASSPSSYGTASYNMCADFDRDGDVDTDDQTIVQNNMLSTPTPNSCSCTSAWPP